MKSNEFLALPIVSNVQRMTKKNIRNPIQIRLGPLDWFKPDVSVNTESVGYQWSRSFDKGLALHLQQRTPRLP
jgi:hypothetical protein